MNKDALIYREYLEVQADPKRGTQEVLNKFGISRGHLYNVIRRVLNGNPSRIKRELEKARLSILWEHKYKVRFMALPKNRNAATIAELRLIVRAMDRDRFPQAYIAQFLKKDRSTIIHHLNA